jgi:hypothetical protein
LWWKYDIADSKFLTWNCICDRNDVEGDSDVTSCLWLASCTLNCSHGQCHSVVHSVVDSHDIFLEHWSGGKICCAGDCFCCQEVVSGYAVVLLRTCPP